MTQQDADSIRKIPSLLRKLYEIVGELESQFGRRFTPDGHLVGSIGEVVAAYLYGLTLLPASEATHDAKASDGRLVQIKATQGRNIALRQNPNHLIVLQLKKDGVSVEIYNGPGDLVWRECGPKQNNGQRAIGVAKLIKLMGSVKPSDQLPVVRSWPS